MKLLSKDERKGEAAQGLRNKLVRPSDVLFIACLVFVTMVLFLGQKSMVKKQKSDYGLEVPFLTSTILMATSFVNLPAYIHYLRKGKLKAKSCLDIVKRYGILGCIDGTQSILATYSFLNLQGSAYILIKCSSIVFSFLLSKLVLKKETNVHHYISVFGIIVAFVVYYFGEIQKENLDPDDPDSLARTDLDKFDIDKWYIPVIVALLSAFMEAVHGVISAKLFKKKSKKKNAATIAETAFYNGVFATAITLPFILIDRQAIAGPIFSTNWKRILLILIAGGVSKQARTYVKFVLTNQSSALFQSMTDILKKLAFCIFAVVVWREPFPVLKQIAVVLIFGSAVWYAYAAKLVNKKRSQLLESLLDESNNPEKDSGGDIKIAMPNEENK